MYIYIYTHTYAARNHTCTKHAETWDRIGDLQIFSLTLSQLSYCGKDD